MNVIKNLVDAFIKLLMAHNEKKGTVDNVVPIKPKKPLLSAYDVITSSGRYQDRASHPELTEQVKRNIVELLNRVNPLLEEIGWDKPDVTSGFRTEQANKAAGGSKNSSHKSGEAVDLADPNGELDKLCTRKLLEKYNLYREDSSVTSTWCHLSSRPTKSGRRIFMP